MDNSVGKCIPILSQRKNVSWSDVESAEDVLANILSRLPVKCLSSFKTVSKLWHRLIRSPSFTLLHLSQSREHVIYILYPFMDVIRNLHLVNADGVAADRITLPGFETISTLSMICSYNGLICFTTYPWFPHSYKTKVVVTDLEIRMCNPATHQVRLLPKGSSSEQELGMGVAFGPGISEYRVFRFFHSKSKSQVVRPECEIFSSSTGTWSGIGCVQNCPMGANHVFVNGKIYWFIASEEDHEIPGSILSVDMEENFKIISLPDEVTEHSFLINLEGCISLVVIYDHDEIVEVWISKDEDASDWEKKCSDYIPYESIECLDSVAARNNDIFFITTEHYFFFNTDEMTWNELDCEELFEGNPPVVFTYSESLLPCS